MTNKRGSADTDAVCKFRRFPVPFLRTRHFAFENQKLFLNFPETFCLHFVSAGIYKSEKISETKEICHCVLYHTANDRLPFLSRLLCNT